MRAIRLVSEADEETKDKLRNGELSINGAIKALEKRKFVEIIPGHTVGQILTPEMMGYQRPSDDVAICHIQGDAGR